MMLLVWTIFAVSVENAFQIYVDDLGVDYLSGLVSNKGSDKKYEEMKMPNEGSKMEVQDSYYGSSEEDSDKKDGMDYYESSEEDSDKKDGMDNYESSEKDSDKKDGVDYYGSSEEGSDAEDKRSYKEQPKEPDSIWNIEEIFQEQAKVAEYRRKEEETLLIGIPLGVHKTDINMLRSFRTDPKVHKNENHQRPFEAATTRLVENYKMPIEGIHEKCTRKSQPGKHFTDAMNKCKKSTSEIKCDPNACYRTADGTCNNLRYPRWGSAGACLRRLLPPCYEGQSGLRKSAHGGPLPQPRHLSMEIHNPLECHNRNLTHCFMFWAQFVAHDTGFTPISTTANNQAIQCCPPSNKTHPQCAPIMIPEDDPFYKQFGTTCMNFVRSAMCPTCKLGHRQQMNQVTAFIDGSAVYGSSQDETNSLRAFKGGKLQSEKSNHGDLLPPPANASKDFCSNPKENKICFKAGDSRVNQHPTLTCLHTIFMRFHNYLCDELAKINPHWKDETLFQVARKILGACLQHIVYYEYLPLVIGKEKMSEYDLWVDRGTTRYDGKINPGIYSEFTTAGGRFGHSLIKSLIAGTPRNATCGKRLLRDEFFQPFEVKRGLCDLLLRGVASSPAQCFDAHLEEDVTNFLYRIRGNPAGLDLAAINIQRGRDHGLPPYVKVVKYCTGYDVKNFSDLRKCGLMSPKNEKKMQENYKDVNDIDLWTGMLCEIPLPGAVVGPTGACLIGIQFKNLKFGDRFFFTHKGQFTHQQMKEIRKTILSIIMCLTTKMTEIQKFPMLYNGPYNPMISCKCVKHINLSYWKEQKAPKKFCP